MNPNPPYHIFLSVRSTNSLNALQKKIKANILKRLKNAGYVVEEFSYSGDAKTMAWDNEGVRNIMARCQGAIILVFEKWGFVLPDDRTIGFGSGFHHYEGALALAQEIPILIIAEKGLVDDGILFRSRGKLIIEIDPNGNNILKFSGIFRSQYETWRDEVNKRFHVFLGYSSGATATAHAIRDFLEQSGNDVRVMDWQRDFGKGGTILDQISEASRRCLGGIFLFTQDDALANPTASSQAVPRDNVVFEAGYFMHAKGDKRTLMVIEDGVKIPADVSGQIYLPLADRHDITPIQDDLLEFVRKRL